MSIKPPLSTCFSTWMSLCLTQSSQVLPLQLPNMLVSARESTHGNGRDLSHVFPGISIPTSKNW